MSSVSKVGTSRNRDHRSNQRPAHKEREGLALSPKFRTHQHQGDEHVCSKRLHAVHFFIFSTTWLLSSFFVAIPQSSDRKFTSIIQYGSIGGGPRILYIRIPRAYQSSSSFQTHRQTMPLPVTSDFTVVVQPCLAVFLHFNQTLILVVQPCLARPHLSHPYLHLPPCSP